MYKFEKMTNENLNTLTKILLNAYPGIDTTPEAYSARMATVNERPDVTYYTVHDENDAVVGGYNMWDFDHMNFRGIPIKAGGIGSVCVDLARKKQGVAKALLTEWLNTLPAQGRNFSALYPFAPAFYHKMGFGFGTMGHQMRIKPADLPNADDGKTHIRQLTEADAGILADYYNKKVATTHGLINKAVTEFETRLKTHQVKFFAYEAGGQIHGYMAFLFKRGVDSNFLSNDILVNELFFDSPTAFGELMAFTKSQADQVRYIIINTQDEGLMNIMADPRNQTENTFLNSYQEVAKTGQGIMYRIVDFAGFVKDIADVRFGNLNLVLKLNLQDSFLPQNNKSWLMQFADGRISLAEGKAHDGSLTIDVAELSSLIMGCVTLTTLIKYGKASLVTDTYLYDLHNAFITPEKPICTTFF